MVDQEEKQQQGPATELLRSIGEMDARTYNVCKTHGFTHLGELVEYYLEHGTFKKLRHCGAIANLKLINICKRYSTNKTNTIKLEARALTFKHFERARQALESGYIDALVVVNSARNVLEDEQTIQGKLGIVFSQTVNH